jgi:hypothetical protein
MFILLDADSYVYTNLISPLNWTAVTADVSKPLNEVAAAATTFTESDFMSLDAFEAEIIRVARNLNRPVAAQK